LPDGADGEHCEGRGSGDRQRTRVLSDEEEMVLFKVIPEEHKPLPLTALHTGLRRSELFRLRLEDLDFYTRMVNVRKSKT
jgi:integrase